MKMLFFSADGTEVEKVGKEFAQAGIACEVRTSPHPKKPSPRPGDTELWIRDDRDCHRALMLCAELGIGFSKRPARNPETDEADPGPPFQKDEA
jgi:hypothetical protein